MIEGFHVCIYYFHLQMALQYYSKNLKGECEPDHAIPYYDLAGCEANDTRPVYDSEFDRWIAIQAISNDDDMFFELAPSDRVEFLKIRYGIRVSPHESYRIGLAIYSNDYLSLYRYHRASVITYLESKLDTFDFVLMDMLLAGAGHVADTPGVFNLRYYRMRLHSDLLLVKHDGDLRMADVQELAVHTLEDQGITEGVSEGLIGEVVEANWAVFQSRYGLDA